MRTETDRIYFPDREYKEGKNRIVDKENSTLEHIRYSRILLGSQKKMKYSSGNCEVLAVVLKGEAVVKVKDRCYEMAKQDVIYIPMNHEYEIASNEKQAADVLIFETEAERERETKLIRFDSVKKAFQAAVRLRGRYF